MQVLREVRDVTTPLLVRAPNGFGGHAMHSQHNIAAISEHTLHTLTPLREPAQNYAGGIRFTMIDGLTRVICWVSREALDRINRGSPCEQGPMVCFERHRGRIEHLASQRYVAGERSPIIMTFNLETLRWSA